MTDPRVQVAKVVRLRPAHPLIEKSIANIMLTSFSAEQRL